ncbi:MAG TPA: sulfite exporter TauE/SafE family protein, partial [Herpetosiphonaceae bacterium]|nr:sulfite exporter TauE/SafE family protein [Herpetosiphonaceae bacterium]
LEVGVEQLALTYVVDMAEIPTFQEFGGALPSGQAQAEELTRRVATLRQGLKLSVDGRPAKLQLGSQALSFPPGQGGLATTRVQLHFTTPLRKLATGTQREITYEDANFADRLGWHEVVVQALDGVAVVRSDAPAEDLSNELRVYPDDMLASPLDLRAARVLVAPGSTQGTAGRPMPMAVARPSDRFTALINTEQLSPFALALTLLAALGLGAMHALSPGHGKTIVAAYLVGAHGTARHALFLGFTVTTTHTLGVFVLGLITLYASHFILPEQLYPWLSVISGIIVIGMGVTLLHQRLRGLRRPVPEDHTHEHDHLHEHAHAHDDHHHAHDHHHTHAAGHVYGPHTHTHLPPGADGATVSWRSLLALGISGGLLPCPSALVVMLSAISLGRVGFGLLLIVAFSLGLAGVLTGVGILFVHGGRWFSRLSRRQGLIRVGPSLRFVPVLSALVVTTAGLLITAQALVQANLVP